MLDKPGVMIYFELIECLKHLTDDQAGKLFRAILHYGATRQELPLTDSLLPLWPIIRMRLDTDDQRYFKVSLKRRYAIYVRWNKSHGHTPLSYDEWLANPEYHEQEDSPLVS